jgi:hypothetical protein
MTKLSSTNDPNASKQVPASKFKVARLQARELEHKNITCVLDYFNSTSTFSSQLSTILNCDLNIHSSDLKVTPMKIGAGFDKPETSPTFLR